jgi:magnesium transporter
MRVVAFQEGRWDTVEGLGRTALRELALGPVPVWIRADSVAATEWTDLGRWFDLHPLALEDIQTPGQRPKVEGYGDITFAVIRAPRYHEGELTWISVGLFLGHDFVLTATAAQVPEMDALEQRLASGAWPGDGGAVDRVFYHVVDALVDAYFPMMDALEDDLETLEDIVLERADRDGIEGIRDLKNLVSRMRKVVPQMREAALSLERNVHPNVTDATRVYLRDVSDHMARISERLDHVKEVALTAQETWNATLAAQQNEAMKRLTVLFALFLVPTFLASVGGMNFPGQPAWPFWSVTGAMFVLIVSGVVFAWRRRLL